MAVAEGYLGGATLARPHHDRHLVLVHLERDAGGPLASLHLGPVLPDACAASCPATPGAASFSPTTASP